MRKKLLFKKGDLVSYTSTSELVTYDEYGRRISSIKQGDIFTVVKCFRKGTNHSQYIKVEEKGDEEFHAKYFQKEFDKVAAEGKSKLPFVKGNKVRRIGSDPKRLLKKNHVYTINSCYFDEEPFDYVVTIREVHDSNIFNACNFKIIDPESDEGFKLAMRDTERMIEV